MTEPQWLMETFGVLNKNIYLCARIWETLRCASLKLVLMFSSTMKYAKLAWVYAKGVCGLRRKVYDLQFVYVPEDKLWYIDMPWHSRKSKMGLPEADKYGNN